MEHITITGDAPGDYGGLAGDGGTVVALGNFDGVHIGHQALLAAARERRDILGGGVRALVWTFTRHTADELGTHGHVPCITTPEEKVGLFGGCGMDGVIFENFDNVRDMEPGEFVDEILVKRLKCRAAVYGFNFRFGRGGKADAAVLSTGIPATVKKSRTTLASDADAKTRNNAANKNLIKKPPG